MDPLSIGPIFAMVVALGAGAYCIWLTWRAGDRAGAVAESFVDRRLERGRR